MKTPKQSCSMWGNRASEDGNVCTSLYGCVDGMLLRPSQNSTVDDTGSKTVLGGRVIAKCRLSGRQGSRQCVCSSPENSELLGKQVGAWRDGH